MKLTDEQRKEIKGAHRNARNKNHYIGDDHHSETIDEWVGLLLSSEQVWREEANEWQAQHNHWYEYAVKVEDKLNQSVEGVEGIKQLFEAWDLKGICRHDLKSAEQSIMLELVESCEKLVALSQGTEETSHD